MLTATTINTRKSSRITEKLSENKRSKIDENVRMTRSRSNEVEIKNEEITKTPIRRSPRQSLSGKENLRAGGTTKDEIKEEPMPKTQSNKQTKALKSQAQTKVQEEESQVKADIQGHINTDSKISTISEDPFNIAKRAFHRSGNFKIIGRVEEKANLTSFWYDHVESSKGGASIYISGNPGTGKTALVDELIPELIGSSKEYKLIKINCMMLKDPLKAFQEIAESIKSLKIVDKNPYLILNSLEGYFCSKTREKFIIIIDEVDQIGMKDPELLCKLLAMPYLPNSKVCVFGIANSIDLTERFLPRLKLLNCEPAVLHFPQYTVPDITAILCDRLERINSASACCFIDKPAIELTARKVASTGDLRRALDILRQAIDLAEDEYKLSTTTTVTGGALVKLSHVVKIMEKFGSSQSGPLVLLKSLNLHQKVILAAIVGFPQEKGSILTIQKLYEEYCAGASRPPKLYDSVTRSEFIDLISNLESMSLIGKSTESANTTDLWKLKVYMLIPNELVKTMISQELPTIKVLFGL